MQLPSGSGPARPATVLTFVHRYKACLTFFWRKYPHPSQIRSYFPEVNFSSENITALINYYTALRKYYFDTMEAMARAALASGITSAEEIDLRPENEEIVSLLAFFDPLKTQCQPDEFLEEVGIVVKRFFETIQKGEDASEGWKKSIYKIVSGREMDVPAWLHYEDFMEYAQVDRPIR